MDDATGTAEAARRLRMSPQRVRALWHEGALSGRIMANRLLLDLASVLDLAERDHPAPVRPQRVDAAADARPRTHGPL
jgi:hypothetical protein